MNTVRLLLISALAIVGCEPVVEGEDYSSTRHGYASGSDGGYESGSGSGGEHDDHSGHCHDTGGHYACGSSSGDDSGSSSGEHDHSHEDTLTDETEETASALVADAPVPNSPIPGWGPDGYGPGIVKAFIPGKAKDGVGAFRITHPEGCLPTHTNTDDMIVHPNQPGKAHLHQYYGNPLVDAFSTVESLEQATETSCPGGIRNLSAYWFPAMLDKNNNVVPPSKIFYYWKGGYMLPANSLVAPPYGLRFVFGGDLKTQWPKTDWFGCSKNRRYITGCSAGQEVEVRLHGPQCWDGVRLDSPDHKSHLAWASWNKCPASHPVRIPQITVAVFWKIPWSGAAGLHLSSDMAGDLPGITAHADFVNLWKPQVFNRFLNGCIKAGRSCNLGNLGDGWRLVPVK